MLKHSGNNLFWNVKLRNEILNLLYVFNYFLDDLIRLLLCDVSENISAILQHLQNQSPPLVKKCNESSYNITCYVITQSGEVVSRPNFTENHVNIESFSQIRIGQMDIQNFETKIDELISQMGKEPNLTKEKIKIFKEKLLNLKNNWIETSNYRQEILPLLTSKSFEELFPKSLV